MPPRKGHALGCLGRYVLVAGGVATSVGGGEQQHQDTWVFDPNQATWQLLDDQGWCWSGNGQGPRVPATRLSAGTCQWDAAGLLLLRSDTSGQLARLVRVALQLPEPSERARNGQQQPDSDELAIVAGEVEATSTSVRLRWAPPSKDADKLLHFKVMVTDPEGRSWEAFQGTATSAEATGLAPNTGTTGAARARRPLRPLWRLATPALPPPLSQSTSSV